MNACLSGISGVRMTRHYPHLFSSENVLGEFDLGEVSFADSFQKSVAADVGLLVCCGVKHVGASAGL